MKETITAKELEEAMNAVLKQARKMENSDDFSCNLPQRITRLMMAAGTGRNALLGVAGATRRYMIFWRF